VRIAGGEDAFPEQVGESNRWQSDRRRTRDGRTHPQLGASDVSAISCRACKSEPFVQHVFAHAVVFTTAVAYPKALHSGVDAMFRKILAPVLVVSLTFSGYASVASATVISTQQALSAQQRSAVETSVRSNLSRSDVRQAMVRMGVDPVQADARIAALSDEDLVRVQGQLDRLPAGGDALAVVGIVFIVLLILELTGVTNIFNRM